jgi:hypothetical protein
MEPHFYGVSRCPAISCCSGTKDHLVQEAGLITSLVISQYFTALLRFRLYHSKLSYLRICSVVQYYGSLHSKM